jgi:hypothetical protein
MWHEQFVSAAVDTMCTPQSGLLLNRMSQQQRTQARGTILFALSRRGKGPAARLNAVVVGRSDAKVFCRDGWWQRWHRLALVLSTAVARGLACRRPAAIVTSELAPSELVSTHGCSGLEPAVTRHLARSWSWCSGASACAG